MAKISNPTGNFIEIEHKAQFWKLPINGVQRPIKFVNSGDITQIYTITDEFILESDVTQIQKADNSFCADFADFLSYVTSL